MSRLQSIENALIQINDAVFQNLCDSYLTIRNPNYAAFSRTGSQQGKQKTTKGTPDSFLLLPNGKYIFLEYSTNVSKGVTKLKEDIEKCLDTKKTGIPINQINEIILCINFNLDTKKINSLKALLRDTYIRLTLITLDSLAIELHIRHRDIVHEYLGLPFDTGQIISIDRFVEDYNKAGTGIATPLDNHFIRRETEEKQLKSALANSDFIILTGPAGVGKTKLAIEVIRQYIEDNPSYTAYGVSYKHTQLLEDLYQYFEDDNNYVLFVDDANRIDAFGQISGFFSVQKAGRFKVVITVRDYAFSEVEVFIEGINLSRIDIDKLTDEQIVQIIEAEPFEILYSGYQDQIKQIADGNPRLAVMAALLVKKEQNINSLGDASMLFDKYYATFVNDEQGFASKLNLKILGLIAFFYTLQFKDKESISSILTHFGIEYLDFIEAIEKLDRLELVEVQFDNVKIPEQNLSTYFFFRAFIKEQLLSFHVLMVNYYESNKARFRDNIIPAFNTFDDEIVTRNLTPHLRNYWQNIKQDRGKAFSFLPSFWFLLQTETLDYLYKELEKLPDASTHEYDLKYETNQFSNNKNDVLDLLGEFLRFYSTMKDALELAVEYVRKLPKHAAELIHIIRERMSFDPVDDRNQRFLRQFTLFDFLIKGITQRDKLKTTLFFELSKTFMEFRFETVRSSRNNAIQILSFKLDNSPDVQKFRSKIWDAVKANFQQNLELGFEFLRAYGKVQPDVVKEVMEFDLTYLIDIINQYLTSSSFDHCKYVQHQVRWCKRNDIEHDGFKNLTAKFRNPLYELYVIVNWDHLRDKESFDFEDYREYEKLKEEQIRTSIVFNSREEINKFYEDYRIIKSKSRNTHRYNNVLTIILLETFNRNNDFGLFFLKLLIERENETGFTPNNLFNKIVKEETIDRILNLLYSKEFEGSSHWRMSFFFNIPSHLIKVEYLERILEIIKTTKESVFIDLQWLEQYLKLDSQFFKRIIEIIYVKNQEDGSKITVWNDIFIKQIDKLGDNFDLIKKFYIQQDQLHNHFDYSSNALQVILKKDPDFLLEYIRSLHDKKWREFKDYHEDLSFVWKLPEIEKTLTTIIDFVNKEVSYKRVSNHFINIFFKNLKQEDQAKADSFLLDYANRNYKDTQRMNMIIDVVNNSRPSLFENVLLTYLACNKNVEDFTNISWRKTNGVYSGEVNFGDLEAADWRNILSIIEKVDLGIQIIPIKNHIKENIENALKWADSERRRRFLERRF